MSKLLSKVFLVISTGSVLFAVIAQYGFAVPVCHLCLYQRYVLMMISIVSLIHYFWNKSWLFWCISTLSFLGSCLSFYHLGVENKWWVSSICQSQRLDVKVLVPCDQVNWSIFGVSAVFWTWLLFLFLAILSAGSAIYTSRQNDDMA